jgi:hypothetical protein
MRGRAKCGRGPFVLVGLVRPNLLPRRRSNIEVGELHHMQNLTWLKTAGLPQAAQQPALSAKWTTEI